MSDVSIVNALVALYLSESGFSTEESLNTENRLNSQNYYIKCSIQEGSQRFEANNNTNIVFLVILNHIWIISCLALLIRIISD